MVFTGESKAPHHALMCLPYDHALMTVCAHVCLWLCDRNTTAKLDTYNPMVVPALTKRKREKEVEVARKRGYDLAASAALVE